MKTALIIDDENNNARLLEYIITKRSSATTLICESIEDGLQELKKGLASMVFLNLELPGAVDFLLQTRKMQLPVVAVISQTPEALLAVRLLGVDHLLRPFDPEQVVDYLGGDRVWKVTENARESFTQR